MADEYGLLDHVHLSVSDLAASRTFYAAAVGALGLALTWEGDGGFEIGELSLSDDLPPDGTAHIAFKAASRRAVNAFDAAAVGAGGRERAARRADVPPRLLQRVRARPRREQRRGRLPRQINRRPGR
jgi:catechol 2,3-dioxygenase-like lactoylglutathione lyase family enzyme